MNLEVIMDERKYFACKIAQRGIGNSNEFVVFAANARDITSWAGIRRVGEHEKGTQRILKDARVNAIQRFLKNNIRNIIPTSVILAFLPGIAKFSSKQNELKGCLPTLDLQNGINNRADWGILSFEFDITWDEHLRPALIVDGQHRLKGMAKLSEDVPVLVVALIDATPEEQAFQFVVINNKSARIPTDNVKAIISDVNETDLQDRLSKAGVNYGDIPATLREINDREDSPFHNLLDWQLNPDKAHRIIKLTTLEASLRYIRNQIPAVTEMGDEDTEKEIFLSIWRAISGSFEMLWNRSDKFMSKVNINALNEFVVDRLENAWVDEVVDVYDSEQVEQYTTKIIQPIPTEFWTRTWAVVLQDNAVVRELIKADLKKISHNVRNPQKAWHEELKLIGQNN